MPEPANAPGKAPRPAKASARPGKAARRRRSRLRLAFIGAGAVTVQHLPALERLGRTELVGVVSRGLGRARAVAEEHGGTAYVETERMLDEQRPDAVFVLLPPHETPGACASLVERGIPFLTEKPIAADPDSPARLAAAIERAGLVVAVGYHLRGVTTLPEVRARFAERPPRLLEARWIGDTPPPTWWRRVAEGGGQIIEQATHFFDLARLLLGEATVLAATSSRGSRAGADDDVADLTGALLRFERGAIGVFSASRLSPSGLVEMTFVADGLTATLRPTAPWPRTAWTWTLTDVSGTRTLAPSRDPYEVQDEAFLDAVEASDPSRVLSTYADALATDRLTRAVVAATGAPG